MDMLSYNLELSNPTHLSVEEVLKLGDDPNGLSADPSLCELELWQIPMLFIAICGSRGLYADFLEHEECGHEYYEFSKPTGNVNNTHLFLKYRADPNTHMSGKTWALHVAVSLCKFMEKSQIVKELIEYGTNANAIGPQRKTPLHLAVTRNNCFDFHDPCKDTINALLLPPDFELDPRDACLYYQPKIMQALLEVGAGLNAKDARGRPLHMLFERSLSKSSYRGILFDILLADPRVKIDERDNDGFTSLYAAAICRPNIPAALKFVKKVVRMPDEVDINSQDSQGRTPLWGCVTINQYDMTRLLLGQDRLDPNLGPADDFPLLLAVGLNQQQTLEHLLESKRLDVNKQNSTGKSLC